MPITNGKEVLMETLAHVRSEDKTVLIFLVDIVHAETFPRRIGKSSNHIITIVPYTLPIDIFFYPKWLTVRICYSIMVVNPLISKAQWGRNDSRFIIILFRRLRRKQNRWRMISGIWRSLSYFWDLHAVNVHWRNGVVARYGSIRFDVNLVQSAIEGDFLLAASSFFLVGHWRRWLMFISF